MIDDLRAERMLLVLLQVVVGFIDFDQQVVLVVVQSLDFVVDDVGGGFDLVLRILDVLLVFLYTVDVEQIVFLELREFLVQSISLIKEQLVLIIVVWKFNQVQ